MLLRDLKICTAVFVPRIASRWKRL